MTITPLAKDGFTWKRGMISNVGAWTLIDPDGLMVAHVYQGNDRKWCTVDGEGTIIADQVHTCGEALRAGDAEMRPCAWVDPHPVHGVVGCGNGREHASVYCAAHASAAALLDAMGADR
jgi:hypothetical protein